MNRPESTLAGDGLSIRPGDAISSRPMPMEPALSNARRWAITASVMLVSVLQILDTSITNVALPHI